MHKVRVRKVTLTFKLETKLLHATHCHGIMIICPFFFSNPTLLDEDIGRTNSGYTHTCTNTQAQMNRINIIMEGNKYAASNIGGSVVKATLSKNDKKMFPYALPF